MIRPCENCPYRLDAPRQLWHRAEFEGVLKADADLFGKVFNCHKHAGLPLAERGFCAGWLLDQRERGLPSVALRLELCQDDSAAAAVEAVSGDGLVLFPTVDAMCRANGIGVRAIRALRAVPCAHCRRPLTSRERAAANYQSLVCGRCRKIASKKGRAR